MWHWRRPWLRLSVFAGLGAVAALGQAPLGLWPCTILALALGLVWLRDVPTRGGAFGATWALGLGYFGTALHWIVEPFFVDMARTGWMAPFAVVLLAAGLALFWGAAGVLAQIMGRGRVGLTGLIMGFGAAEAARSLLFTGFPWALLGHVWIDTPVARLAAFVGPHGLTLVTLALAALVAALVARGGAAAGCGAAALLVAAWFALLPGAAPQTVADGPVVRLVQPNARQEQKWDPGMARVFLDRLLAYSAQGPVPDLIVWPETALQYLLESSQPEIDAASEAARGAPLVTGIVRRGAGGYYNSLIVLGRAGEITDLYDKAHLVPFGEYFPYADIFERWGLGVLPGLVGGGYAQGPGPGAVSLPGIGRATALICYEGIFAQEVNALDERPRLIVLITNDAWFGDWAGPSQHFAQARLRAIEQGLPLVRVANTGISGMIDGRGRVIGALPLGAEGALDLALPPALAAPPYTRWGDSPALAALVLLAIASVLVARRKAMP